jgi:hypothetical protein
MRLSNFILKTQIKVKEHERQSNITLRHKLKFMNMRLSNFTLRHKLKLMNMRDNPTLHLDTN